MNSVFGGKRVDEEHLSEFRVVDEVWSVSVDECTQSEAVLPADNNTDNISGNLSMLIYKED